MLDNPNNDVRPVTRGMPGSGLNKQIAILVIRTKTDNAGINLFTLRS